MRIQGNSGFIGIGTTNPLSNLDIRGSLILPNSDSRIGIGTTNPSSSLHVRGDITVTGIIKNPDGSSYASSQWSNASVKNNIYYNIGSVGIGTSIVLTTPNDVKLSVAGTITCDKIMLGGTELTSNIISGQVVSATNIQSGTLAVSYGGTGQNSLIKDQLIVGNGTNSVIQSANLTWNNTTNTLLVQGTIGIGTIYKSKIERCQ